MRQAYEGRRVSCSFHFGPTSSRSPFTFSPFRKDADGHWPLRPGIRARRLRRRHGGRSPRPAGPRHRRPRPHRARAAGPPRRLGRRGRDGRRRRHPRADPAPLPGDRGGGGRLHAARRRGLRGRPGLPAHRPRRRPQGTGVGGADGRRGGARGCSGGARCPPRPRGWAKIAVGAMPRIEQVFVAPSAVRGVDTDGAGAAGLRAAQAGGARGRRPLLPVAVGAHPRLQGHAHLRAAPPVLPRPARPHLRVGPGAGALALLDQHLPQLAAGPPVPLPVPQRRDQHAGRQPQLDAGPRGAPRDVADRRGPVADLPDLHAGGERLGQLRRGARVAAPRRALAASRRADDDPRGVGEPRHHGPGAARLLPLPRLVDGAVGRPGRGLLHRRHGRGRRARPQRASPGSVLGHRRRAGRAGQRGGGARHRARACRPQGPPAAGPHVPGRHGARAGWSRTRRSRPSWRPSTPTASGWPRTRSASRSCRPAPCSRRSTAASSPSSASSATRPRSCG